MIATAASTPSFGPTNTTIPAIDEFSELAVTSEAAASVAIHPSTNTPTPRRSRPVGGGTLAPSAASVSRSLLAIVT